MIDFFVNSSSKFHLTNSLVVNLWRIFEYVLGLVSITFNFCKIQTSLFTETKIALISNWKWNKVVSKHLPSSNLDFLKLIFLKSYFKRVTWHFVLCNFNLCTFSRCHFNRSQFQPIAFSTVRHFNLNWFWLFSLNSGELFFQCNNYLWIKQP